MKQITPIFCAALLALTPYLSAKAQSSEPDYISVSAGYYDILDDADAADFRVEYRPSYDVMAGIQPWIGAEITSQASLWVGAGLLYNWEFTENWYLIPNTGAGYYARGSSDLNLGYALQFRSQLELAHEYETGSRAGISFGHLSNASLDDDNPGTEVLSLYFHVPY